MKKNLNKILYYIFPAFLTGLVLAVLMYVKQYAPFGGKGLNWMDADIQYLDFYAYFKDVLEGKNSIAYTFGKTLGGTNVAVFSYYLSSPFILLAVLFKKTNLTAFLDFIVVLKLMLSASTFCIFLTGRFRDKIQDGWKRTMVLILSVSYALCQYNIAQSSNVNWLDGVYLLPLMLLFVYQLVNRQHSGWKLAVTVGIAILFNWYSAGMDCLFSLFWFFLESAIKREKSTRNIPDSCGRIKASGTKYSGIKNFFYYIISMLVGVMLSAVLFLPTTGALQNGSRGSLDLGGLEELGFRGSLVEVLQNYVYGGTSGSDRLALFSGVIAAIGFLSFFVSKKTGRREKRIIGVASLFGILMFYWNPLFLLFSLLKRATSYWCRFSYLNIFLLLFVAALYFLSAEKEKNFYLPFQSAGVFAAIIVVLDYTTGTNNWNHVNATAGMALVMGILLSSSLFIWYQKPKKKRIVQFGLTAVLICLCLLDLSYNASLLMDVYHSEDVDTNADYFYNQQILVDAVKEADSGYYRVSQTTNRNHSTEEGAGTANYNESLAYHYWSISGYTSSPDDNQRAFLQHLGYRENSENYNITNTSILGADSLLGVKYVLSPYPIKGLVENTEFEVKNQKKVYQNPYALPMAFLTHHPVDNRLLDNLNPFAFQNSVYSQLLGRKTELYRPVQYEIIQQGDVAAGTPLVIQISIPEGNYSLYGNLPWNSEITANMDVNGQYTTRYACWGSESVFYIPYSDSTAMIQLTSTTSYDFDYSHFQFYALDLDQLAAISKELSSETPDQFSMENGAVSAEIANAEKGDMLFLSVPADSGWTITNNGKEIQADTLDNCLYLIPLQPGRNEISLQYHVPYKNAGILVTIAGIIGTVFLAALGRRKTAGRRRKASCHRTE